MGIIQEFKDFLNEYKVMGVAVAFIMAAAVTALVQSLVKDIIMPVISPFMSGGWETATFTIGPIVLRWGSFLSALVNFVILAFVIFLIAKLVMKKT